MADQISTSHQIAGNFATAARINVDTILAKHPGPHAQVEGWVVDAPWAHPMWRYHVIHLIHLRPVENMPPCIIHVPGATHELVVMAVNPEWKYNLDEQPLHLEPINFAAQFIEPSDEAASLRVRKAIQLICDGKLSPDIDHRRIWANLFGAGMIKSFTEDTIVEEKDPDRIIVTGMGSKNTEAMIKKLKQKL